ncbi:alpha/beta fold hydrolase [Rhodobacteraceae bacterium D3-12]|nr:alpha/beta fold hydrolase [Rhodobacteraceae bacterium D3-12]
MTHDLNIITTGPSDGPPLLLIHGAWHGAWCWQDTYAQAFAESGFYTHSLDLRGHGNRPAVKSMRWNRIRDYVDDAAATIAAMPSPPIVIGHSMGGFITQHLMARGTPMRGAGLLASLPHSGALPVALKTLRQRPLTFLRILTHASLYPMVQGPAYAAHLFLDADTPAPEKAAFHAQLTDESFLGFLDMTALALPRKPVAPPPVCVVGGALDQIFPPKSQHRLARRFNTTAHIIPDAPHNLMLSKHWRASFDIFLTWARALPT